MRVQRVQPSPHRGLIHLLLYEDGFHVPRIRFHIFVVQRAQGAFQFLSEPCQPVLRPPRQDHGRAGLDRRHGRLVFGQILRSGGESLFRPGPIQPRDSGARHFGSIFDFDGMHLTAVGFAGVV